MRTICLESVEDFGARVTAWDEGLKASGVDDPFQHSDFILTWWKYFSADRLLRIIVVFEGDKPVAGLPLYVENNGGEKSLRFPGASDYVMANYTNIWAVCDWQTAIDSIFQHLSQRDDWDVIYLDRLYTTPPKADLLWAAAIRQGHYALYRHEMATYMIDVPATFEEHIQRRGKKFRRNIRRAYRVVEKRGELNLDRITGELEVERLFADYVKMSVDSYRRRSMQSTFEDEKLSGFFGDLLKAFDRKGVLNAYRLRLGQQVMAIGICYSIQDNMNYILTGFSAEFDELEPGHLLTGELLKRAIEKKMLVMDFYTGEAPYKVLWCNRKETVHHLVIARATFRNKLKKGKWQAWRLLRRSPLLTSLKRRFIR